MGVRTMSSQKQPKALGTSEYSVNRPAHFMIMPSSRQPSWSKQEVWLICKEQKRKHLLSFVSKLFSAILSTQKLLENKVFKEFVS